MLFDLIFYVPSTIYHYCRDGSSWTSTKLRLMCLAHPPTYHYLPIYQYLPVHQPTHLPTLLIPTHGHPPTYHYTLTHLPTTTYIPTYAPTCTPTYLPTYLHTHLPTCTPTNQHTYLPYHYLPTNLERIYCLRAPTYLTTLYHYLITPHPCIVLYDYWKESVYWLRDDYYLRQVSDSPYLH